MPSGQALIDLLAPMITPTSSTLPMFKVNHAGMRRILERETKAIAAAARQAGPTSTHHRLDVGNMTLGVNSIRTVVLLGADGIPTYPQSTLYSVPNGGSVVLNPQTSNGMILIAIAGMGSPGAKGGDATVKGGKDCLCIALGGRGGKGVAGQAVLMGTAAAQPNTGGNGGTGGDARVESGDGSDLYAFSGPGGAGGFGSPGINLSYIMSTSAVTPNPTNSPIISIPSNGGAAGPGGPAGTAICIGGDGAYALATGGNGGAPGRPGDGGIGGTVPYVPTPLTYGNGLIGKGSRGGEGGATYSVVGTNGSSTERPGLGGRPGPKSGPGATAGPNGSPI